MKRTRLLSLVLSTSALALLVASFGCKPKQTMNDAADSVSRYAKEMGTSAEKLGTKAGQTLGLVEKKWDYVRLAFRDGEPALVTTGGYAVADERELGRALVLEWLGKYKRYSHDRMDRYLNRLAAAVTAYSARPASPVTVIVLDSEEVMCFGTPGGYVLVTLGGLRAAESESELAGYLALGIAHAQLNHSLTLLERIAGGPLVFEKGVPQEPVRLSAAAEETVALILRNGYAAADTQAAAREATQWMIRLGYEPGSLKAFSERVKVRKQAKNPILPAEDLAFARQVEEAVDQRLAELHAPTSGRTVVPRFRRECMSCLPIPR